MERKLDWPLEVIESLKLSVSGSEDHRRIVIERERGTFSECGRCHVRWPCLAAQLEAIERGRIRRSS